MKYFGYFSLITLPYCLVRSVVGSLAKWIECLPNGLEDLGSIPGCVIPKTLKMVLDTSLFNTQQYKVCIEGKVEQSRERSSAFPYTLV